MALPDVRTTFFALLAANLGVWGWSSWFAPASQPLGSVAPSLPRILLASEAPPPPVTQRCVAIGPYLSPQEVSAAGRKLEDGGYQPSVRTSKASATVGYIVVASGFASSAAQRRAVWRLRLAGISDAVAGTVDGAFIVTAGKFNNIATARARAAASQRAGVTASVQEQSRQDNVFWLEFALKPDSLATPESLQAALLGNDHALQVQPCEPVTLREAASR